MNAAFDMQLVRKRLNEAKAAVSDRRVAEMDRREAMHLLEAAIFPPADAAEDQAADAHKPPAEGNASAPAAPSAGGVLTADQAARAAIAEAVGLANHGGAKTSAQPDAMTAPACETLRLASQHTSPTPSAEAHSSSPPRQSDQAAGGVGAQYPNLALAKWAVEASVRSLEHYGHLSSVDQAIEECAELIVVLRHSERPGRIVSLEDIASEIADVYITAIKLRVMYGADIVDEQINRKLARLDERMRNEPAIDDGGDRWNRRIKTLEAQLERARQALK